MRLLTDVSGDPLSDHRHNEDTREELQTVVINSIIKVYQIKWLQPLGLTASVVYWSEFLATDPEVPGSILSASRFSAKQRVWNGVHSAS
jgi:hypothetical protein